MPAQVARVGWGRGARVYSGPLAGTQPKGIGIVEGRLAGPAAARFERARAIGFDAVELSFSGQDYESLPLWTASGAVRVHRLAAEAGVDIPSTCASYFNRYAFASRDEAE